MAQVFSLDQRRRDGAAADPVSRHRLDAVARMVCTRRLVPVVQQQELQVVISYVGGSYSPRLPRGDQRR